MIVSPSSAHARNLDAIDTKPAFFDNETGRSAVQRVVFHLEPHGAVDAADQVDALHEAAKDRLVIIIAHRLSTIAHADRIYFLEEGEIHERGTHDELMAMPDGHYRKYATLQAGAP